MAYPDPPTTPPVPQRGDRATFSGRVDAFLTWVAAIIPWLQGYIADFMATLTTLAAGGANSFSYRFDTATSVADPGPGFLRLNASPQNTASRLIIDPLDRSGIDISSVLNSITTSTSSIKGSVRLQKVNEPASWMLFDITGFTSASGFYNLTLAFRASSSDSPFSANDGIVMFTERNGDRGENAGQSIAKFSERKATGLGGGANVAGNQDRILNTTEYNDIAGASLGTNQFTLPAGSYEIDARCPTRNTGESRITLLNVTDSTAAIQGGNALAPVDQGTQVDVVLSGKIVITSPKKFKIQQYTRAAHSTGINGLELGYPTSIAGTMEIYSEIKIRKVA